MKIKHYSIFLICLLFISACEKMTKQSGEEIEEKGSGILVVESVPADADLFVDNAYKGKTALTLYNFDAGSYSIAIKKEGYEDYKSVVNIEAGKKTEIRAYLSEIKMVEEEQVEKEEEIEKEVTAEEAKEEIFVEGVKDKGIIDIGSGLTKYYDFSEKRFTDKLTIGSDIFSRRYPSYLVFIRYSGVEIKVIDKNIDDVKKEDCDNIIGSLGFLYSGQTLCINTKEDYVAAIGGTWKETAGSTLSWKIFN